MRLVSAGLSPRRVGSIALGWAWGEAGPLREAIPPPREGTTQEELRVGWQHFSPQTNSLAWCTSLNADKAGIMTLLADKSEEKNTAWGHLRALQNDEGCHPQWR